MEMCEQAMKWFPEAWCCQCLMLCPGQCWNDKSLRPLPTYLRHCGRPQPPSDTIPGLKGTILQFYPNTKFTTKPTTSDCVGVLHSPLRPRICQFIYVVLVRSRNVLCLCCIFSSWQLAVGLLYLKLCDIDCLIYHHHWLLPPLDKMCPCTRQVLQQVLMGFGEARHQECVPVPG